MLVEKEKPVPLIYEEVKLEYGYKLDLLVDNRLILEIKSVDAIADIHIAQTLTYMKLMNKKFGLLFNFNVVLLKDGIKRLINKYYRE
jgi:GxxExxY protein